MQSNDTFESAAKVIYCTTLESGIDVGQGINVGHGKIGKNNKRRPCNKRRAWTIWQTD